MEIIEPHKVKHSGKKGNKKLSDISAVREFHTVIPAAEARAVRYCTAEDVQIYFAKHDPRGQQFGREQRGPRGHNITLISSREHTCGERVFTNSTVHSSGSKVGLMDNHLKKEYNFAFLATQQCQKAA